MTENMKRRSTGKKEILENSRYCGQIAVSEQVPLKQGLKRYEQLSEIVKI